MKKVFNSLNLKLVYVNFTIVFLVGTNLLLSSCKSDENSNKEGIYDPAKPVAISEVLPDTGRLNEKVVIQGNNFGYDKSKVHVFFADNNEATVVGVNNQLIYCLAPRQPQGKNSVKVYVEGNKTDTVAWDSLFSYTKVENVTTIAGMGSDARTLDGTLSTARFNRMGGIVALGNDAVIVFQDYENPAVRYVSVPDNAVITLQSGFTSAKACINKDKTKVYAIGLNVPHTIYCYQKSTGWIPGRIGQLGSDFSGTIYSLAMDGTQEWLYFIDSNGTFGRFDILSQQVEILKKNILSGVNIGVSYLVYSPVEDCFYYSVQAAYGIYKISLDGLTVESYAGFNGNKYADGDIVDAGFQQPNGLTVDDYGDIYVCDGFGSYLIRKISIKDRYVSTVAGQHGVNGQTDGDPLKVATLSYPYDISYDGAGGYWICETWGARVCEYAVQ